MGSLERLKSFWQNVCLLPCIGSDSENPVTGWPFQGCTEPMLKLYITEPGSSHSQVREQLVLTAARAGMANTPLW